MHGQEGPRARHSDGERHRDAREGRTLPRGAVPSEDESQGGERRGGGGRMAARERRGPQQTERSHVRPDPIDRDLDRGRHQRLTTDHEREEQWDGHAVALSPPVDAADEGECDDHVGGSECREDPEGIEGEAVHVFDGPPGNALVDTHDPGVGPDHVHDHTHHRAGDHDGEQRNRERESGRRRGVEPGSNEETDPIPSVEMMLDGIRRRSRRIGLRPATHADRCDGARDGTHHQEDRESDHVHRLYPEGSLRMPS